MFPLLETAGVRAFLLCFRWTIAFELDTSHPAKRIDLPVFELGHYKSFVSVGFEKGSGDVVEMRLKMCTNTLHEKMFRAMSVIRKSLHVPNGFDHRCKCICTNSCNKTLLQGNIELV
jgi:hypothetical protein